MVSAHLKNISQIGSFPQIVVKIKNFETTTLANNWNQGLFLQKQICMKSFCPTKTRPIGFSSGILDPWIILKTILCLVLEFQGIHSKKAKTEKKKQIYIPRKNESKKKTTKLVAQA